MTVNIKLLILVCVLYSYKRNKFSVALTGIVLVKKGYAIASAKDVSQVPRKHIIADSRAMFVVRDFTQWFGGVKGVTVHPDFEYNTFNSIALLQLTNSSSIPPICFAASSGKLVNQLYAMGYTDKNKILEKVLYKMNYVKPDLCEEFYNRVGFKQPLADEQEYVCGAAPTNREHCRWDSGMVLASNTTGYWQLNNMRRIPSMNVLLDEPVNMSPNMKPPLWVHTELGSYRIQVGFGVGGPGCAAPVRFISTPHYLPWIESAIEDNEPTYYHGYNIK